MIRFYSPGRCNSPHPVSVPSGAISSGTWSYPLEFGRFVDRWASNIAITECIFTFSNDSLGLYVFGRMPPPPIWSAFANELHTGYTTSAWVTKNEPILGQILK